MTIRARQIALAARPTGSPEPSDFRLGDVVVPEPGESDVLLSSEDLTLDPCMRGLMDDRKSYLPATSVDDVMAGMIGEVVAEVVQSRQPEYAVGDRVAAHIG